MAESVRGEGRVITPSSRAGRLSSTPLVEGPMLHWHYIGYIDPRHPLDLSVPHCPPNPTRPVPADLVARLAAKFGVVVGEEVIDRGGYLLSHLGYFGQLHPFEAELVAQGCVVLTEMREVVQPPEAVRAYQDFLDEWAASRTAQDHAS